MFLIGLFFIIGCVFALFLSSYGEKKTNNIASTATKKAKWLLGFALKEFRKNVNGYVYYGCILLFLLCFIALFLMNGFLIVFSVLSFVCGSIFSKKVYKKYDVVSNNINRILIFLIRFLKKR